MSRARLVITAVTVEKRPAAGVAATYGVSRSWLYELLARYRDDRMGTSGTVTLRTHGKLRHIGIGRTHAGTHVILLVQDLNVRIVNAITGELLRELTLDLAKDYQPHTPT